MNEDQRRNEFQLGLKDLVEDALKIVAGEDRDPFAGDGDHAPHEHDTRSLFVDRLLELLGWRLGPHGNVLEEARLKADTTRFMDYVGVVEETKAPLMIFEAKAWDKPYITARVAGGRETDSDLLVAAIRHYLDGKAADTSPVTKVWHEYVEQIGRYVKTMKANHQHDTPRVVLASGPWLVVFTDPVTTFFRGQVSGDQFKIFRIGSYVDHAHEIFILLHRSVLARDVPFPLRPAQLPECIDRDSVAAVYHGLHVHFEQTGSPFYGPQPRVLVYPALIVERNDGVLITVTAGQEGLPLAYTKVRAENAVEDDQLRLDAHMADVQVGAANLLATCEAELGCALAVAPFDRFPGFSVGSVRAPELGPRMVMALKGHHDEWLLITGVLTHYLTAAPRIDQCRYHTWAACHAAGQGIGNAAISVRSIKPRAVFIDTQVHHCAHQVVEDRRALRCHISPIDQRTCCQTCIYADGCWPAAERPNLPCGH